MKRRGRKAAPMTTRNLNRRAFEPAPEIETRAKMRLADEYDASQERGELAKAGNPNCSKAEQLPGPTDLGSVQLAVPAHCVPWCR